MNMSTGCCDIGDNLLLEVLSFCWIELGECGRTVKEDPEVRPID